jgi:hypothetical protein
MRRSRPFRPSSMLELEARVVPSQVAPGGAAHAAEVRPVTLTRAEIAQSNASEVAYSVTPTEALQSGFSVAEDVTTRYNDGSTRTASVLEVPNIADSAITTDKTVNLRNNGGTETVVQTETFSTGIPGVGGKPIPFTGNTRTYTITTTMPDGEIQTETETEVFKGDKSFINGTIDKAGGGVETLTEVNTHEGPKTVSKRTDDLPDGSVEHSTVTTVKRGDLDETTMTTTTLPDGKIQRTSSATNVILVLPPSSSSSSSS